MINFKTFEGGIRISPEASLSADPVTGKVGQIYWNTTRLVLRICVNSSPVWQDLFINRGLTDNSTLRWDAAADAWIENDSLLSLGSSLFSPDGNTGSDIEIKSGTSTLANNSGGNLLLTAGLGAGSGLQGKVLVDTISINQVETVNGKDLLIKSGNATTGPFGGNLDLESGDGNVTLIPGTPEESSVVANADVSGSLQNKYFLFSSTTTDYYAWYDTTLPAVAEITDVQIPAAPLTGQYFLLDSASSAQYYVWYNVDTGGGDPVVIGRTGIEVAILSSDTNSVIATKTATELNLSVDFSAVDASDIVTITDLTAGNVNDAIDFDTGFLIITTTQGTDPVGATDPLVAGRTGVPVVYVVNDTANTIASLTQIEIDAISNVTATVLTDTVTITNDINGNVTDAADFNTGFSISVTTQGIADSFTGGKGDASLKGYDTLVDATNLATVNAADIDVIATNRIDLQAALIGIKALSTVDPAGGTQGDIYFNTSVQRYRKHNGTSWGWIDSTDLATSIILIDAKDDVQTVLPPTTATLVDGYTIVNGSIVCFTNLTSGANKLYKATVAGINITWTVVVFGIDGGGAPQDGEFIYVKLGTNNIDTLFSFDGTIWKAVGNAKLGNGDRNIAVVSGGTKKWVTTTNTLSWAEDAFVQVPELLNTRNRIVAGSVTLTAGQLAYVIINRTGATPASLTVNVATIDTISASSPANDNLVVIARRVGDEVFWGINEGSASTVNGGILTGITLNTNQISPATVFTLAQATYDSVIVKYSLQRGSTREIGHMFITHDGTTAAISTIGSELGTTGVTFTADISGSDLRLRYTTNNSPAVAAEMRYSVDKWLIS
jgi:hypothetical protein